MKKNVYVLKNGGGSSYRVQVGKQSVSNHHTQAIAIKNGKEVAKARKTELVIQGENGRFRSKDSYGNDPKSIRDKEH
ncbi:MAG: DUF2188 domain-containing protein [Deltaproteobacteria bacterium]|nr:DUF2188 domain-containing protein [Deltaproteobacteria bacterium]